VKSRSRGRKIRPAPTGRRWPTSGGCCDGCGTPTSRRPTPFRCAASAGGQRPCSTCTGRAGTSEQPWSNHGHDRPWLMNDRPAIPDGAAALPPGPGRVTVCCFCWWQGEWPRGASGLHAYHPASASVPSTTNSRPASIPAIHTVVLVITWLIDAAASWCPAARPGTARPAARQRGMSLLVRCLLFRERVVRCGAARAGTSPPSGGRAAAECQRTRQQPARGPPAPGMH